jgi:hypothetical protein
MGFVCYYHLIEPKAAVLFIGFKKTLLLKGAFVDDMCFLNGAMIQTIRSYFSSGAIVICAVKSSN